ncbi:MAG: hypothetical protein H4O13_07360 [Xanthomonadales bacterium]|nr:hypothetical protein [Xanthomonadales bacterium]
MSDVSEMETWELEAELVKERSQHGPVGKDRIREELAKRKDAAQQRALTAAERSAAASERSANSSRIAAWSAVAAAVASALTMLFAG